MSRWLIDERVVSTIPGDHKGPPSHASSHSPLQIIYQRKRGMNRPVRSSLVLLMYASFIV